MTAARDLVARVAYSLGWTLIRRVPERWAYAAFDFLADLAWWRHGRLVRQLEANLGRVRPDASPDTIHALSRQAMRSYLRYWCDAFRLPDWSKERISTTVRSIGDQPVRHLLNQGRGVVVFLGHLGNWDHAGAWSTLQLAPVTTVAEQLRPPEIFARFLAFREQLGMRVLPLSNRLTVFRELQRTLRSGGFVPLLADRDLTGGGVEVDLFGEPARVAGGPAALALTTGAALFTLAVHYEDLTHSRANSRGTPRHGIVLTWYPVDTGDVGSGRAAVAALTQRCIDQLAVAIGDHPEDWHMLQPIFLTDSQLNESGARR